MSLLERHFTGLRYAEQPVLPRINLPRVQVCLALIFVGVLVLIQTIIFKLLLGSKTWLRVSLFPPGHVSSTAHADIALPCYFGAVRMRMSH